MNGIPQRIQVTMQDILNVHAYLKSVTDPSPTIQRCIEKVEAMILNFAESLSPGNPSNH